ncbi:MAG: hypothetical protein HYY04_14740 [Chloroflexi bacterium]|nr:hypothetical protein [Chloroflexota bacterium]
MTSPTDLAGPSTTALLAAAQRGERAALVALSQRDRPLLLAEVARFHRGRAASRVSGVS